MPVGHRPPAAPAFSGEGSGSPPKIADLPDGATIYWKVKAIDRAGHETTSLETDWRFTVVLPAPTIPIHLRSPENGGRVNISSPLLVWQRQGVRERRMRYSLLYGTDPSLAGATVVSDIRETSYRLSPLADGTSCYWKVLGLNEEGKVVASSETARFIVALAATALESESASGSALPRAFALQQNYPNPFNPATSIRFDIPAGSRPDDAIPVALRIYDARGRLVRTLLDGVRQPGSYLVTWDGRDDLRRSLGSGIYIYRLDAGNYSATRKMAIVK